LDPENIDNILIYLQDIAGQTPVQIYASQQALADAFNFQWSANASSPAQLLMIPTKEISRNKSLSVAFTSTAATQSAFTAYRDFAVGRRYGKEFKLGDFPAAGYSTISFDTDSAGPALGGYLVSVTSKGGDPDVLVTANKTQEVTWWQGGSDKSYQTVFMYRWQLNDDPNFGWNDVYRTLDTIHFSGWIFSKQPSQDVQLMVAPFTEISQLKWYGLVSIQSLRHYFLIAVDSDVVEIWLQYRNYQNQPLSLSHVWFNLTNELPTRNGGDELLPGETKYYRYDGRRLGNTQYILGSAYTNSSQIYYDVSVFLVTPLTTGVPDITVDVNSTFSLYKFEMLDIDNFPDRGAVCSASFSTPQKALFVLLDFKNLTSYNTTVFTQTDGIWTVSLNSTVASPIYIYVEAVNGSSFSLTCTHTVSLPTRSFSIPSDTFGLTVFNVRNVQNRYYKFPQQSLLHLYPTGSSNYIRLVANDFGITSGYDALTYQSIIATEDTRMKSIESSPLNPTVALSFNQKDNVLLLTLENSQFQWDYDYLLTDLKTTLLTFQGGSSWTDYVDLVIANPAQFFPDVENNQKLAFDITNLARPTTLTVTVPKQWVIPQPADTLSATVELKE